MPSHEGLGADNRDGLEDCRKPPIQLDEEQAITIREPDTSAHLPPQYDELMPQRRVLCLSRLFDLNGDTNRASQRQNSAIIVADVRRFAHVINTDGVLGTYKASKSHFFNRHRSPGHLSRDKGLRH